MINTLRYVAFFLAVTLRLTPIAVADSPQAACGEWTVCPAPTATAAPTPTPKAAPLSDRWGLPACVPADDLRCKNKCHGTFGADFWNCVQGCLDTSCSVTGGRSGGEVWNAPDDAKGCVEIASYDCNSQCSDRSGASAARCRTECLQQRCPDANRLDVAREGASPGTMACDRCVDRVKSECSQSCGVGVGGGISGIGGLICERSCLTLQCGAGCSIGFP